MHPDSRIIINKIRTSCLNSIVVVSYARALNKLIVVYELRVFICAKLTGTIQLFCEKHAYIDTYIKLNCSVDG